MDNSTENSVAQETEIPVSSVTGESGGPVKKSLPIKLIIIPIVIVVIAIGGLLFILNRQQVSRVDSLSAEAQTDIITGKFDKAEDKLTRALEIKKDDPVLLSQMINAISLQGNQDGKEGKSFDKSKNYIESGLKTGSDNAELLIAVGYAYETDGQYKKALDYYKKAESVDPKSSVVYFHLGHASQFLGDNTEADKYYAKAYDLDPNNPQILMVRGNQFFSEGNTQDAYESFKKASENKTLNYQSRSEALVGASLARVSQDNFKYIEEATALSKKAVEYNPNSSPALGTYGYNLFLGGMQRTGFDYIVKATEANPRISRNYFLLSMIYRTSKDYTYAITAGKEAIDHVDDDNTIVDPSGKTYQKALYTFELAKTYSVSGLGVDTTDLLKEAIVYSPEIAGSIKASYEAGMFQENINNPEFQSIISS